MMFSIMIKYLIENVFFLLGYIGSGNLFPKPLSQQEEEMYFKLYKDGDEEAKKILIERNLRLVVHIAKKYSLKWKDNDDLISIGSIGLIKAVATYDYEKGHRFATYAARCIQNAMVTCWKFFDEVEQSSKSEIRGCDNTNTFKEVYVYKELVSHNDRERYGGRMEIAK